jgi:4-hydroxybenzoate polyprenyltransferase
VSIGIALRGYCNLCRISNLPSVWTNVLCAAVLATGRFSWDTYVFPALSLSLLYLAGMALNDVCDAPYDAVHRPGRPIPSGAVSRFGAMVLTAALAACGLLALIGASGNAFYAALVLIAVIIWYDLDHKRNPYSVLLMASCRFLLFMVTSLALTGKVPVAVLGAAVLHFLYIVLLSTIARYENSRLSPFALPVIPLMLAAIPLIDGCILAVLVAPLWLIAGVGGAFLLHQGQKLVRGD